MFPFHLRMVLPLAILISASPASAEVGHYMRVNPHGGLGGPASPANGGTAPVPQAAYSVAGSTALASQSAESGACTPVMVTNTGGAELTGLSWTIAPAGQGIASCTPGANACAGTLATQASCAFGAQLVAPGAGTFSATGNVAAAGQASQSVALSGTSTYAPPPSAGMLRPNAYYTMENDRTVADTSGLYDASDATGVYVGAAWVLEERFGVRVTASRVKVKFTLASQRTGLYQGVYFEYWDYSRNNWGSIPTFIDAASAPAGKVYDTELSFAPVTSDRFRLKDGTTSDLFVYTMKIGDTNGYPP